MRPQLITAIAAAHGNLHSQALAVNVTVTAVNVMNLNYGRGDPLAAAPGRRLRMDFRVALMN